MLDELLGGTWLPPGADDDPEYPADAVDEIQALLSDLVDQMVGPAAAR
ncbi:MAG: hypothetical protein U0168_15280 [Nannocystaceae bacterium]